MSEVSKVFALLITLIALLLSRAPLTLQLTPDTHLEMFPLPVQRWLPCPAGELRVRSGLTVLRLSWGRYCYVARPPSVTQSAHTSSQALLNGQDSKYMETGHIERLEIGVKPVLFPLAFIVCGDFYIVNTSSQLSSSISPIKITSLFYGSLWYFNNLIRFLCFFTLKIGILFHSGNALKIASKQHITN